jgi:hypothetical protein
LAVIRTKFFCAVGGVCWLLGASAQAASLTDEGDGPPLASPQASAAASAVPPPASDLLQQGFAALSDRQPHQAVALLQAAVATGELNEAGRTLAYWYLFVAWQRLGGEHQSAEALLSFVTVAADLMDDLAEQSSPTADLFAERFDLKRRLARARATLSAVWAAKADGFGRRSSQPVPVQSSLEQDYFIRLMVPCTDNLRTSEARPAPPSSGVQRVIVRCKESQQAAQRFYFSMPSRTVPDRHSADR